MKNQRTKYIKVRMTPEEVQQFKEKSASYSSVSHYIRSALAEYSNIGTKRQLELINDLGLFYRKYQNELSWAGGNLNQSVKRANRVGSRITRTRLYPGGSVTNYPRNSGNIEPNKERP